ncbi:MAG: TonB-dependent receptor [Prevotella sp.]|nr:TonB-dependent receptor [Prevotella sp.]
MNLHRTIITVASATLISMAANAEDASLKGTVTDAQGEPLIGAMVHVEGTSIAAATDIDGNFSLTAPVGKTLKVSYVGFDPVSVKVTAGRTDYRLVMNPDASTALDEIVVVGYGTQKKSEVTGSISHVKSDAIKDFSVNSVADALGGMSAGVAVTKSTGSPGETPDIIIRGAASVNGMSPLFIVDGVKLSTGFDFNMRDVESIEILKDAGSCAIYGAEAAGGVILVTTKRGKAGQASLNLTARYGIRKITKPVKLLNRDEFIAAKLLTGVDILGSEGVESASELPDVDWMDVMYDTGHEQEYNLSLTGGTERLRYFLSGGFYNEKGTYVDSSVDRFSLRTNVDYEISKIFSVGSSIYGSVVKNNPTKIYSIYTNSIPFRTVPTMEPVDEDGNFSQTPFYLNGPNLYGNELTYHYKGHNYGLNALLYLNVNIMPWLTLRVNGAGKFTSFNSRVFSEEYDFRAVQEDAYFESSAGTSQELTYNATLTFDRTFARKWGVKAMIGTEATAAQSYSNYIRAIDFPVDQVGSVNLSSNTAKEASDSPYKGRALSFFGRVNLSYDNRYYLTANVRRDGSDRFSKNHRWGTFPSVNVMWRIGQESFLRDKLPWLTDAKLRGSYGILGNDGIAQFLYTRAYVGDQIIYNYGGTAEVSGWANYKVPNADIKWEEVHQGDFGIDLSLFNNRLTFSYDYYNRQTHDMLYWKVVPYASGINYYHEGATNTMPINIGRVSNIGHEIAVNWTQRLNDFNYSVGFNASFNSNKVKQIGEEGAAPLVSPDGINRTENGRSMSELYGYSAIGIFQSQEQVDEYNARAQAAGRPYYWQQNTGVGDLIFDDHGQGYVDENCKEYIGNPWPKMTYGINLAAQWRGFDLSAVFQGAAGFQIYNAVKAYTQTFATDGNTTIDIYKCSFFGDNGLTDQPRCGMISDSGAWVGDPSKNYSTINSFWVEDGDYLKCKNLVFGYTLPENITRKAYIQKLRVYFSASNLFTITKYSGIDPEIGGTSTQASNLAGTSMTARGVDTYNRYIPSRLFSFGLDLTF